MPSQSRKTRTVPLLAALLLSLAFLAPAHAESDPLLAKFVGKWVGRGTYKASPNGKPEMVYCSVSNKLADGGNSLEQSGRCALSDKFGRISGKITARGLGQYEGSLQSASTIGPAWIAGTGRDGHIEFNAQFTDRMTRKPGGAIISLVVAEKGGYRLTSNALGADGKPKFVASDIVFTQQ
ncbi:MAG: hypothetical protein J0H63_07640 [Rhizobiales bacterium]|nr:hypothetical protein [Hyphomicrobiales bacterium]MBN9010000.1 hypothetical protein [Hyphomicrobiales bacterium]